MAAEAAVRELVHDGMVLGLGSGSTVAYAVRCLGERVRSEGLEVLCVPTSYQIAYLAVREGLKLTSLEEHPELDLAIDGADQVDGRLNLIKGGGAALAREKVVDSAARELAIDMSRIDKSRVKRRKYMMLTSKVLDAVSAALKKLVEAFSKMDEPSRKTFKVGLL